jgi:hypothetical protein
VMVVSGGVASTNVIAFEQPESPPAFDAVALIDVEESSATSIVMPLPVNVDGSPIAAGPTTPGQRPEAIWVARLRCRS